MRVVGGTGKYSLLGTVQNEDLILVWVNFFLSHLNLHISLKILNPCTTHTPKIDSIRHFIRYAHFLN